MQPSVGGGLAPTLELGEGVLGCAVLETLELGEGGDVVSS